MAKLTVQDIRQNILDYGFSAQNYSKHINRWIDDAQRTMFRRAGLRQKANTHEITANPGEDEFDLPEDFGSVISLRDTTPEPDRNLEQIFDIRIFDELEDESGEVQQYIIWENKIRVYPKPSSTRTLILRYNIVPSQIAEESSTSPSIAEDYYHLIEVYVLAKCYQKQDDIQMFEMYKKDFEEGMVAFIGDVNTDTKDDIEQVEGAWPLGYF